MDKRILCVRHEADPTDDRITAWCAQQGLQADIRRPFLGDGLGGITDDLAGVVVYGGIYNAYDTEKHPFLADEYRLIDAAMQACVPLLGLCQGAQMIAHHMGAFAGAPGHGNHEFGYYEITPTDAGRDVLPTPMHVTQAHFHTFDIPSGATHLARSALFENQAFAVDEHVMAFQFHPEQTIPGFTRWQDRGADWGRYSEPGVQERAEQTRLMHAHDTTQHIWFMAFLNRFFGDAA